MWDNIIKAKLLLLKAVSIIGFVFMIVTYLGFGKSLIDSATSYLNEFQTEINIINEMAKHTVDCPKFYFDNGQVQSPCPNVPSQTTAVCKLFASFPYTSVKGVFVYRIKNDEQNAHIPEKLVIYSDNPRLRDNRFCIFLSKDVSELTIFKQLEEERRPQCKLGNSNSKKSIWMQSESEIVKVEYSMGGSGKSEIVIHIEENVHQSTDL